MKTTTSILSILLISLFSSHLFAQIESFDLTKYKVADYKRQELNFNFQSNGGFLNTNWESYSDTSDDKEESFNLDFSVRYAYFLNNRSQQKKFVLSTNIKPFGYYYNSNTYSTGDYRLPRTNKSNNFNVSADFDKKFYQSNNFYYEIGNTSNISFDRRKEKSKTLDGSNQIIKNTSSEKYANLYERIILGIGKGRIENVEDARMAVFIMDDLLKKNKQARQPTEEEILELATKITQIKNKRFFDSRNRKIYEIQAIDSFLRKNNLTTDHDAIYFTTIFDNWNYSNNPIRQSGTRISLNYNPFIGYYHTNSNVGSTYNYNLSHYIFAEFVFAKPLNLKWQRNISIDLGYLHTKNGDKNYDDNYNESIAANVKLEYGYYPNSRSYYTMNVIVPLVKNWNKENDFSTFNYTLQCNLDAYYYISERFLLTASASLRYGQNLSYSDIIDTKYATFSPTYSVYLTYNLF